MSSNSSAWAVGATANGVVVKANNANAAAPIPAVRPRRCLPAEEIGIRTLRDAPISSPDLRCARPTPRRRPPLRQTACQTQ